MSTISTILSPDELEAALRECAREPIRHSGAIQPAGYLLACSRGDWIIRHVSANCGPLFGMQPAELVGLPLTELLDEHLVEAVALSAATLGPDQPPVRAGAGNFGATATICQLGVHLADGLVQIEIEPGGEGPPAHLLGQQMVARLVEVDDEERFHRQIAEEVRGLTGFDRVMVYRFLPDDTGEVIAEARAPDLSPYLGLRYPASDIPPQARALYLRNRIRVIPNADYVPVPIVPSAHADGQPLDLSQHALRSVSPVHLAYLHNMGVAASMSISIVVDDRLWGLIACHHRSPRAVPPDVRGAADLFGLFVSMRVAARELQHAATLRERAQAALDRLEARLVQARVPAEVLVAELALVAQAVPADGVALWRDGHFTTSGRAPDGPALEQALAWFRAQGEALACTSRAADWCEDEFDCDGLAGLLGLRVGADDGPVLLVLRREQVEDVRWAGRPDAPFQLDTGGGHIGPRSSFAAWRETMRGMSRPWTALDRSLAERLRMMLRHRYVDGRPAAASAALAEERAQSELLELRHQAVQLVELVDGLIGQDPAHAAQLARQTAQVEARLATLLRQARA